MRPLRAPRTGDGRTGAGTLRTRDERTDRLLRGPLFTPLLRLAIPNVLTTTAQASTGLIETYFIAHLGTDALAGMPLVFPMLMLVQMISAGAVGGGSPGESSPMPLRHRLLQRPTSVNAAHPFENPLALSNFIRIPSTFAIGAAMTHVFGRMIRDERQG